MSFGPNDPGRPCCSSFVQPVSDENRQAAVNLQNRVEHVNRYYRRLNIVYRPSRNNIDMTLSVIRWTRIPYQEVLRDGFRPLAQGETPDEVYYDLDRYVHEAGAPLGDRPIPYGYIGTTIRDDWRPPANLRRGESVQYYRYEIYAPGGIWIAQTLGGSYRHTNQAEVCFVGGIAPQYIRSCVVFTVTRNRNGITFDVADSTIILNGHFNPHAHPWQAIPVYLPTYNYRDRNGVIRNLNEQSYRSNERRQKREISNENQDTAFEWYAHKVGEIPIYITGAFRSGRQNEAYLFMKDKYVLIDYAPGTTGDKVLNGPIRIRDGFPSLKGTPFGEEGIGCAFAIVYSDAPYPDPPYKPQAYIFNGNLCAYIDYAPRTTDDKIISGPMTIVEMFPFFKNTVFENGIDAAFNGPNKNEVYLFRADKYALINYDSKKLIHTTTISDGFPSLQGTIFASDIEAAFASHRKNEAYLFKGEFYALIDFAPGTTDDYIIGHHIKKILPNWPSLSKILPLQNKGVIYDIHQSYEVPDE